MKIITAREAAKLIPSDCVLASDGFMGIMVAEEIYTEIDKRIQEEGAPKGLTLFHISGQGDSRFSSRPSGLMLMGRKLAMTIQSTSERQALSFRELRNS